MKKIFAMLLCCIILLSVSEISVKAANGDYVNIYEQYVEDVNILSLDEIEMMDAEELAMLELLPLNPKERSVNGAYTVAAYNIMQINGYYCGPASVLQAIYASGNQNLVSGATNAEKQRTLASSNYLQTDYYSATPVEAVPGTLNTFIPRNRLWTAARIDDTSASANSSVQYYARSNHSYGYAVVYLVCSEKLGYYKAKDINGDGTKDTVNVRHCITGTGIYYNTLDANDYNNIEIRLSDPNNQSNGAFFGTYIEPLENVVKAMNDYTILRDRASFIY
jgi:hypothetical protein